MSIEEYLFAADTILCSAALMQMKKIKASKMIRRETFYFQIAAQLKM
jgi:hypothetical protein